jgi:hypothetical protein
MVVRSAGEILIDRSICIPVVKSSSSPEGVESDSPPRSLI